MNPGTHDVGDWGVAQHCCGRFGEERNFLSLPEIEPRNLVTIPTTMYEVFVLCI